MAESRGNVCSPAIAAFPRTGGAFQRLSIVLDASVIGPCHDKLMFYLTIVASKTFGLQGDQAQSVGKILDTIGSVQDWGLYFIFRYNSLGLGSFFFINFI